jgi:EAL domain-containing protein (putative c-di-GMP-specific phosphodiesterase class I)
VAALVDLETRGVGVVGDGGCHSWNCDAARTAAHRGSIYIELHRGSRQIGAGVAVSKAWFLESIAADGSHVTQAIRSLPFRIGRDPQGNDLVVDARGLSRQHALIDLDPLGRLRVTDLGSTNGTFVNRERIGAARVLDESDVIHFGTAEFRLGREDGDPSVMPDDDPRTMIVPADRTLTAKFVQHERQFIELLGGHGLSAAAQPIVDAASGRLFAYELLGRCTHPELPNSPMQLFQLAAALDREAELSAAFRDHGVRAIAPRLKGARLFVNTHPKETFADAFFDALKALRAMPGAPQLVVEVHETAVVEVAQMRELAARLAEIGVPFAYDDFGAGQARIAELGEVPAHFVKFDMGLVRGLHEASDGKQRVVRDLVKLVLDLGSVPLAEGEMGFQLVQGYLTGRPVPISAV